MKRHSSGRNCARGFSLIEVMVALAILALALTIIAEAQQGAARKVFRSKQMTIATLLAREKMIEIEGDLFKDGFSDFDSEKKGDFSDEGFERFTYRFQVDKIEFPNGFDPQALAAAGRSDTEGEGNSPSDSLGAVAAAGGELLAQQFEIFRNVLESSIRRVSLWVEWKEGTKARSVAVVAYFSDPRRVTPTGLPLSSGGGSDQGQNTSSGASPIGVGRSSR